VFEHDRGCPATTPRAIRLRTDGGYTAVPVADWPTVVEHLRRFGEPGTVDVDTDRVAVSVGRSSVTVTREGRVETGMPLHGFRREDVDTLEFDHEAGTLRIRDGDGLVYEFRRP
jgi:hypothetical protein